jgi:hypothetical protein
MRNGFVLLIFIVAGALAFCIPVDGGDTAKKAILSAIRVDSAKTMALNVKLVERRAASQDHRVLVDSAIAIEPNQAFRFHSGGEVVMQDDAQPIDIGITISGQATHGTANDCQLRLTITLANAVETSSKQSDQATTSSKCQVVRRESFEIATSLKLGSKQRVDLGGNLQAELCLE